MDKQIGEYLPVKLTQINSLAHCHERHSYDIFADLTVENKNLSRSLLNNCCLKNCVFTECLLDNADLQGTEFDNCIFIGVSFCCTDINSCNFKNCLFNKCKISNSNLLDNHFYRCNVTSSDVEDATINNNIWTSCNFSDFNPDSSSLYSNDFIKCKFIKSRLLTAIYYTVFDTCSFACSEIDSYILGFQFGLRQKDFKNLTVEHFGEKNVKFNRAMALMREVYTERQMPIETKLLNVIKDVNTGANVEELVKLLFDCIERGYVIKVDEIRFIRKVISNLYKSEKISLFYYLFIIEDLNSKYVYGYRKILSENVFNEITILYQLLYSIKMDIERCFDELSDTLYGNLKYCENSLIKFDYKTRPSYRLSELIIENTSISYLPVKEEIGSFHEFFAIAKDVIPMIAALATILGVSVRGIISKARNHFKRKKRNRNTTATQGTIISEEVLAEERKEETFRNENLQVIQEKSTEIDKVENYTIRKETVYSKTVQSIIRHKKIIITEYDSNNLKKIDFK